MQSITLLSEKSDTSHLSQFRILIPETESSSFLYSGLVYLENPLLVWYSYPPPFNDLHVWVVELVPKLDIFESAKSIILGESSKYISNGILAPFNIYINTLRICPLKMESPRSIVSLIERSREKRLNALIEA